MSSTARPANAAPWFGARTWVSPIVIILAVAFVIRVLLLPSTGFHNDIAAFEAWSLTLKDNPPWEFYAKTTFADYPPGYFIVLWFIGGFYGLLGHLHLISTDDPSYLALRLMVKIPALAFDLIDTVLIYAIVKRFARETVALVAAALFALNPATIYVSAYWGQVDSVSWGFVLLALWLVLRSADEPERQTQRLVLAWLVMAFSVLIKPQGALVAVMLIAYAFVPLDAEVRRRRLIATGFGLLASVVLAYAVALLFHGFDSPFGTFAWLLQRYSIGSNVYPYNSVNAFNLYAVKQTFWQPDTTPLAVWSPFGGAISFGATWLWGIVLVLAAVALIVARYLQERTDRAFLEGSMLIAFAFFTLATRMHERYIFGAFILAFPLLAFGRRRLWAVALLSLTTLLNLIYSFAYQTTMETHPPGVDPTNLWGAGSHLISAVNVALFFFLGYLYLGGTVGVLDVAEEDAMRLGARARNWFDPREGIFTMRRLDWVYAGVLTVISFVLCRAFLQWPDEKIFDEIYYARAGEEYLKHMEIFEFTHPPLTKLLVTLSMILHGGLAGDISPDQGIGWRLLNVVVGALMVAVIYLFAKRITGSTLFSAIAAGMLVCDGFHFVQSRIATPEITVAFFSLTTVYAFYRVWTASAARRAKVPAVSQGVLLTFAAFLTVGAFVAAPIAYLLVTVGPHTRGFEMAHAAFVVAFLYVEIVFYLAARWVVSRRTDAAAVSSYADGSRLNGSTLLLPEGDSLVLAGGPAAELATRPAGDAKRSFFGSGRMVYASPAGAATYEPDGTMQAAGGSTNMREMWLWVGLLAVSSGCLAASKWNGLFDFFVVWACIAGVVAQRFWRRPALFGNPFGMPFDVIMGVMLVVSGAIYVACYIPFFTLGHNFLDLVALQTEMFNYHDHLVATHPYASSWWQWPILERPISYYYHDFRSGAGANDPTACCVAEILALPNPFVWLFGLLTVPLVGVYAYFERNRGYALLVLAYFLQWLPWILSPRIAFEYHFFPNLAIIILCNTIVLQKLWEWTPRRDLSARFFTRLSVGIYLVVVVWAMWFFYPVLAGQHVTWEAWHARMWYPRWII
jgi:dolichyl-phosphate-mannose--protein O-mannosyl transferase